MKSLAEAAELVQQFERGSLTQRLGAIEARMRGIPSSACPEVLEAFGVTPALLGAADTLKQVAGQVNVIIHAAGVLLALPYILEDGEVVEALSLGAGNTGRSFDLETDHRIAEFTFIDWKGGPESIRQNALFEDFYRLAEAKTDKERYLYVKGLTYPTKFLRGGRALHSILSKNQRVLMDFQHRYGDRFKTMGNYYAYRRDRVQIVDLLQVVPAMAEL